MARDALLVTALTVLAATVHAAGPDYSREKRPVADTLDDAKGTITAGFEEKVFAESRYPGLKQRLESLPSFWRDTHLAVKPAAITSIGIATSAIAWPGHWAVPWSISGDSGKNA